MTNVSSTDATTGDIPQAVPILPLPNAVLFPGGVLPLAVRRKKSIALVQDAVRDDLVIGLITQRRPGEEDPGADDLYAMGTAARIVKLLKEGNDNYSLVVQGLARFRLVELVKESPYLRARVEAVEDKVAETIEEENLGIALKKVAREIIELTPELPAAVSELIESINHPGHLADLVAANVVGPIEERQAVLETLDLMARLKLVLGVLNRKREILELARKIDLTVKGEMSKTQRESFLRQQREAILQELAAPENAKHARELAQQLAAATDALRGLRARLPSNLPGEVTVEMDAILAELASFPLGTRDPDDDDD